MCIRDRSNGHVMDNEIQECVKTFSSSTMEEEKLTDFAIVNGELVHQLVDLNESVTDKFATEKERKTDFLNVNISNFKNKQWSTKSRICWEQRIYWIWNKLNTKYVIPN